MDEAKSLVHMALTAMFGALIIMAVITLITLGNLMWRAFSRQNDAQRRLQEYSKYSAFDNTVVRGQDVIALMHDTQGSPWIIVTDKDYKPISVAFNATEASFIIDTSFCDAQIGNVKAAVTQLKDQHATHGSEELYNYANQAEGETVYGPTTDYEATSGTITFNYTYPDESRYTKIMEFFTSRGIPAGSDDTSLGGYMKYNAYLLYDGDSTSDIVGIICVEQPVD